MKVNNLRKEFEHYANRTAVKWSIIEQDYILSWMLWGITQT